MSPIWKKIGLLIGFLGLVVLLGYGLYVFFLKPAVPVTTPPGTTATTTSNGLPATSGNVNIPVGSQTGTLPSGATIPGGQGTTATTSTGQGARPPSAVASGGLTQTKLLSPDQTLDAALSGNGSSLVYYKPDSGQFFQVGPDGKEQLLTDKVFHQVQKVTWSPNTQQAVLEYPDGANIVYNFVTKKQVTLPAHWKDFSFSPDSSQLVFKSIGVGDENRWLAVAKSDGSSAQKIEHLGDKDASVYPTWSPNAQVVAMYTEDQDYDRQSLYFVGLNNENFRSTTIEGRDLRSTWSPKGTTLLYSVYSSASDYKPTLWVVSAEGDSIGDNRRNLQLQTWADKCTFFSDTAVYCAVPKNLEANAGLFPDQFDTNPTDIYRIDLKTGIKSLVATPAGDQTAEQLMVSHDGTYLYFSGKQNGRLYQIKLK